jgi:heat shock protein HslJ
MAQRDKLTTVPELQNKMISRRSQPLCNTRGMRQMRFGVSRPVAWIAALVVMGMAVTAGASGSERMEGPTWLAETIKGGGVVDSLQSTVVFASGGRVTGTGGCNRLFATANIAGDTLMFGGVGTTRMACAPALMDQEQKFLGALAATRTFRFEGPYLKFYDGNGAELVRFTELR